MYTCKESVQPNKRRNARQRHCRRTALTDGKKSLCKKRLRSPIPITVSRGERQGCCWECRRFLNAVNFNKSIFSGAFALRVRSNTCKDGRFSDTINRVDYAGVKPAKEIQFRYSRTRQ